MISESAKFGLRILERDYDAGTVEAIRECLNTLHVQQTVIAEAQMRWTMGGVMAEWNHDGLCVLQWHETMMLQTMDSEEVAKARAVLDAPGQAESRLN